MTDKEIESKLEKIKIKHTYYELGDPVNLDIALDEQAKQDLISLLHQYGQERELAGRNKYFEVEMALERAEEHGNGLDQYQVEDLLETLKASSNKGDEDAK